MEDVVLSAQKAAYRYGLKPGEFWTLTPHETYIWIEAQIEGEKDIYDRMFWHAWHVAALSRAKKLEQGDVKKFLDRRKKPKKPERQPIDKMMAQAKAITMMMGEAFVISAAVNPVAIARTGASTFRSMSIHAWATSPSKDLPNRSCNCSILPQS